MTMRERHRALGARAVGAAGALWLLGAAAALTLTGCNILGPAILLVHGPDKTPAQFELEKPRPTIVFVDDRASVLARRALRRQIAESAQTTLLKERVLTSVIDTTAAMTVAAHETSGEPMDLVSLAKSSQAEVLIYVTVDSFALTPDGQTFAPEAHFHVKVIDTKKPNPRVWPVDHEGYPVSLLIKPSSPAPPKNSGEQTAALNLLATRSGIAIAQLFFSHETHEQLEN